MYSLLTGLLGWVDERLPVTAMWNEHVGKYWTPKNFNFWYFFGSLALLALVIQFLSGIWLAMFYKPSAAEAFRSVEYIMRDVEWGWLIRYIHSTGSSFFFIVIYLHMFRALLYGSYKGKRELVWLLGMALYGALMAEAFFGYLLPWGQMSYWGAQVIISLFGALPGVGEPLALWIRGDYVVSDATLNRFFSLHVVVLPMVLLGLVAAHIQALHTVGSNNPDGVEIKKNKDANGVPLDGVPFHPYYTVKDIMGAALFLLLFAMVVFWAPEFGGWFLEHANFVPADPLQTPEHIAPVWYFTPYYAILRAIPDKLTGVLTMGVSVAIFFVLPWIDRHPVKSIRYRSVLFKWLILTFALTFLVLGYLGTQPVSAGKSELGFRLGEIYFGFFLMLWVYSKERSAGFTWGLVLVLAITMVVGDALRFDPESGGLMLVSAIVPLGYFLVFLVAPLIAPSLNESKPVPERVTG